MSARTNCLIAVTIAIGFSCGGKKQLPTNKTTATKATPVAPKTDGPLVLAANAPPGLQMRVSEGTPIDERAPRLAVPPATALTEAAAAALLKRMAPLVAEIGDEASFKIRERSLPAPRTGKTITDSFPPPVSKAPPTAAGTKGKALAVLRFAPEGDVPIAPHLSVTFNQPMIAITSHDASVAKGVPVKLSPEPPGQWRWVGTRTLLFDPKVRFPMATEYTVTIPKGTVSAVDGRLAEGQTWTFSTPAPTMQTAWPQHGPQKRDAVMFVRFDQRIDPAAVLRTIKVEAGSRSYGVRAATDAEIEKEQTVANLIAQAKDADQGDRWVAFRVDELLPTDTAVRVVIGPGTPSQEGPRKTSEPQTFSYRTYAPLKVVEARCSWSGKCPPGTPWFIRFNNPLDAELFDEASLSVAPELPGYRADLQGNYIYVRGRSRGRTTYEVTLPASLTDQFGQELGKDETLSFRVGSAEPTLYGPSGFVVLDPATATPKLSVYSINHKELRVQAFKVSPADWPKFVDYMRNYYRRRKAPEPPGKRVLNTTVNVDKYEQDVLAETVIDLKKALPKGVGHVILVVEPPGQPTDPYRRQVVHGWYQATNIGLDGFADATDLFGWATALDTGKPLSGVKLELVGTGSRGTTDGQGMATLALPKKPPGKIMQTLVASKGDDVAILPENNYWWSDYTGWQRREPTDSLRWFTFDDRKMYKPGETVNIKGWLRRVDNGERGDLIALAGAAKTVKYRVVGPRGNEITKGTSAISAAGGFDFKFDLPKTPNLGHAWIELTAIGSGGSIDGRSARHTFQIQEFRRPEFEVSSKADTGPHLLGRSANLEVEAKYYAGGALPGADVNWNVSAMPGHYAPPNRSEYTFGRWIPWWRYDSRHGNATYQHLAGKTDATGSHQLKVDFLSMNPPQAYAVTAQATVMDVNRQAWSTSTNVIVHPADLYVGLRSDKYFVEQGEPLVIEGIVTDIDGKAIRDHAVEVVAVRLDWRYKGGKYVEEENDPQGCEPTTGDDGFACEFATKIGGTYRIRATVVDELGRVNTSELTRWVAGGKLPPARNVELEEVQIVPDKQEYAPGDTAKLLIQSPFYPAQALVTYRRSGIFETRAFALSKPTATVEVPIKDAYTPNLYVQIDIVGAATRLNDDGSENPKLPKRPAYAKGSINLSIPPAQRTLTVKVEPAAKRINPGAKTTLSIDVRDAAGKPVPGAEVAVVVVDESVLVLTGYSIPNPIDTFYWQRGAGATDHHLRQYVSLARPDEASFAGPGGATTGAGYGRGGGGASGGDAYSLDDATAEADMAAPAEPAPPPAPTTATRSAEKRKRAVAKDGVVREESGGNTSTEAIAVRTNFAALAHYAPAVETDSAGRARVPIEVPDNLTRYRIMAIAVSGEKYFGKGESTVTARMPLMVRPSPPRFLNFGDQFELPIVLQNQTDKTMTVDVAVRMTNADLTDGSGRRVKVPANDRVEVRFPTAARRAGTARFQIAAASGKHADASQFELPVWTPATTEAFATYGEIDKGAVRQPVAMPPAVVEEFGQLEITTSSTQLQALTDAFVYLVAYPYECSEQVSSRILAIAGLRDVLGAFKAKGLPAPKELENIVERDIKKLAALQNHDGGFAFWRLGDRSWPYISIHVAHALVRAKSKGYAVPEHMLTKSKAYLRNIERHIPHWYGPDIRRTLIAYSLYVRKHMGDVDTEKARWLIRDAGGVDKLSFEALGWIVYTMSGDKKSAADLKKIHRHFENNATETAAAANFVTSYADGAHLILHSNRRVDGIVLEALILDKPKSDLIPKVVRGLLAHRTRGRWGNTQENAFVLLAMDAYFNKFEKVTPSFVAQAWLGDAFVGEHEFKGRSTDRHHVNVPMSYLAKAARGKDQDLILNKKGRGRMYYRVGMTYAPASLKLDPADHGFAVVRSYEAVDNPTDVARDKDGTWKIKAGAKVRVRLTMVAENRRYHVALVDPLPAGLEPMNPALAVTGAIPEDTASGKPSPSHRYWWWFRTWYEHQNMRDDRVEAFTSLLWAGVHEYTYVARATTPGTFVVPPTKAEEMYHPETFGRSASDKVIVMD